MAKKAQANAKVTAKSGAKASPKAPVKKPTKAAASAKPAAKSSTPASKATPPKAVAEKKVTPPPKGEKKTPTVAAAPSPVKTGKAVVASVKSTQVAEPSEKIKIDKSMTEEQVKWAEMYNKYRDLQPAPYDMKGVFKAAAPIQHKVLGWGWVVSNDNDRLEVLFKDGKRMLISNYKG